MKSSALFGVTRRLDRSWSEGPARWWLVSAVAVAVGAAMTIGLWSWRLADLRDGELETKLQEARAASVLKGREPSVAQGRAEDFVSNLPLSVSTSTLVQQLQQESTTAGVALVSLQVHARGESSEQLGQTEIAVQLRGSYAACKQVLKQMLERHGHLTVGHLRMRKAPTPGETEVQLSLTAWAQPMRPAASASGRH